MKCNTDVPMGYNRQLKLMKRQAMNFLAAIVMAAAVLCISCGPENTNPTNNTSSHPLTFSEMSTFRNMDRSAIADVLERKGYQTYDDTRFFNGNEEVHLEFNEYELLEAQYSCREEGALSRGRMKRVFMEALNDAKAFCGDFIIDSTNFYAMVNEERMIDMRTEAELLTFIDNCDRSVMNDGYARFYCQGFTIRIHFLNDELEKNIEWNPTPRYTFNGTTWDIAGVVVGSVVRYAIDLGDGLKLSLRDKITFASESTGIYTYHRIVSYSDNTVLHEDSVGLPFTYSTEMKNDNEIFTAHFSQLENIGIEQLTTMTQVSQGVGSSRVFMPEIEEEVTLLFYGSLDTIDAR